MLEDHLDRVQQRIRRSCERVGRDPAAVTLVGVTKGVPVEVIRQALRLQITEVGENRVQEAREKRRALQASFPSVRWHLIGHLQRNKAGLAAELFDVIHSVDSAALADELDRQAGRRGRRLEVLLQVNVAGETAKYGCRPEEADIVASSLARAAHLQWTGLMTLAPFTEDPASARPVFRQLRELRDRLQRRRESSTPLVLSMGMSQDFEVAIEEGADLVRVGTALFGPRTGQGARDAGRGHS